MDVNLVSREKMHQLGFTIIELLVSIGVIAILIGILLPALSGARIRASQVKALNDLRQIGFSVQLYVDDTDSFYPYYPPDTPHLLGPPSDPIAIIFVDNDPWSISYLWVTMMHRVAPWTDHYSSWIGVGRDYGGLPWLDALIDDQWLQPGYRMSNSLVATPHTWSRTETGTPRVGATRQGQIRYPSSKVLFFDGFRPYIRPEHRDEHSRGVLFADGSARDVLDTDATRPVMNRITELEPKLYHDTPDGIHGRDF